MRKGRRGVGELSGDDHMHDNACQNAMDWECQSLAEKKKHIALLPHKSAPA